MSRRASIFAKENNEEVAENIKVRPRSGVRFPDELVFLDNIRENDMPAMQHMLRRASLQMDLNGITDSGMTPLHQAVVDGNFSAVRLLVEHGAAVNKRDDDSWTPLHAACSGGQADIVRYLLEHGAEKDILTDDGETAQELIESDDEATLAAIGATESPT